MADEQTTNHSFESKLEQIGALESEYGITGVRLSSRDYTLSFRSSTVLDYIGEIIDKTIYHQPAAIAATSPSKPGSTRPKPSSGDIVDFIADRRSSYKNQYVDLVDQLQDVQEPRLVMPAYSEENIASGLGTHDDTIIVTLAAPRSNHFWAANVVQVKEDRKIGYVHINPDLLKRPKEIQKFYLAEEWLELMLGFADPDERRRRRGIQPNEKMTRLYNRVGRRNLWQDSPDDQIELQRGLRYLLVSQPTIADTIDSQFELSFDDFRDQVLSSPDSDESVQRIYDLTHRIAQERYVDLEMVSDRVFESMFGRPQ